MSESNEHAVMRFRNRLDAGQKLSAMLQNEMSDDEVRDAVILALPRGGVPIANEVSKSMHIPMDLLMVRKIGAPFHEEFAIGAIAEGGFEVFNEPLIHELNVSQEAVQRILEKEKNELMRRRKAYTQNRETIAIQGKIVILVDDGIATGTTMAAAVQAVRAAQPKYVWIATPVASRESIAALFPKVDCIVCVLQPELLHAVGEWYDDFSQVTDEAVVAILRDGK